MNKCGTLLSVRPCQTILPACYLVQLGFVIAWKKKGCVIRRRGEAPLQVKVVKGCPLIPREEGLRLLEEYEERQASGGLAKLQTLREQVPDIGIKGDLRQWLAQRVARGRLAREEQILWLKSMFPEAPRDYILAAAGQDADPDALVADGSPCNRRKGRTILKAKKGAVLLHLFAGNQRWNCPGVVVEVEKSKGGDLLSTGVFQHVLCWGLKGLLGGVIGGPPCKTVSRCRSGNDGGPPPVRDRGTGRWGLEGLSGSLRELVRQDSVLWLRFLLAYAVAQAASDALNLGTSNHKSFFVADEEDERYPCPPSNLRDPLEIAKWALQQAAVRLQVPEIPSVGLDYGYGDPVFFVWEHPADPCSYLAEDLAPQGGWPSWWAFPEWKEFQARYQLHQARLDQGKFGHVRPKPTVVATSSWFLFEQLHCQVLSSGEAKAFGRGPATVEERIEATAGWSKWAPGLVRHIFEAWVMWGKERGLWQEIGKRRLWLAKLTEEELQARHEQQDHVPFRKGCPICVSAQGRQRSPWRASKKAVYAASFDLAGPFVAGHSFDATVSGRDMGKGYKYFLACAFTVPLELSNDPSSTGQEGSDEVLPRDLKESMAGASPPLDLPDMAELFSDVSAAELHLEPVNEGQARAVRFRARSKRPEAPDGRLEDGPECEAEPPLPAPPYPPSAVVYRTLCTGVPIRSKTGKEVMGAVQALINRLEAYGYPVHRYHADRAQELKSRLLVSWLRSRGIHTTWTPGDTPAGNKAEIAVQRLKCLARKLLFGARLPVEYWPYAILHASNRHWVALADELGIVQPLLLPFGLELQARKRTKTGYGSHWVTRTVPGKYLGQAPNTPGGHLVLVVSDSGEHKVLLTNTVHPLTGRDRDGKPRFRLRAKTSPELALKFVQAWQLSAQAAAKPLPGGESFMPSVGGFLVSSQIESEELQPELEEGLEGRQLEGPCFSKRTLQDCRGVDLGLKDCRGVLKAVFEARREGDLSLEEGKGSIAWGLKKVLGRGLVCSCSEEDAALVEYLNRVVGSQAEGLLWTSLSVYWNLDLQGDSQELESSCGDVWLVALGEFKGGGLWVEDVSGNGPVIVRTKGGAVKTGKVSVIRENPARVHSGVEYRMGPWMGGELWILKAWVHRDHLEMPSACRSELERRGFKVTHCDAQEIKEHVGNRSVIPKSISKFKADEVSLASVAKTDGLGEGTRNQGSNEASEVWFVEFPCEIVDEAWVGRAISLSEQLAGNKFGSYVQPRKVMP